MSGYFLRYKEIQRWNNKVARPLYYLLNSLLPHTVRQSDMQADVKQASKNKTSSRNQVVDEKDESKISFHRQKSPRKKNKRFMHKECIRPVSQTDESGCGSSSVEFPRKVHPCLVEMHTVSRVVHVAILNPLLPKYAPPTPPTLLMQSHQMHVRPTVKKKHQLASLTRLPSIRSSPGQTDIHSVRDICTSSDNTIANIRR